MAITTCPDCGEEMVVGSWPYCRSKQNPLGHGDTQSLTASRFLDPIVVFRKPDGTYSYPGRSDHTTPTGCERVELRNAHEVRRFEREQGFRDRLEHERHSAAESPFFEALQRNSRADLRQKLHNFSPLGRDFAKEAMRRNDQRKKRGSGYESGFHVEALN